MATQQKLKIRLEIGPGVPPEINAFQQCAAFASIATAALRATTAENLYPDAEFTGTKHGATATRTIQKTNMGTTTTLPAIVHCQFEGSVALDAPDS
jgi:hypothetical protein